MAACIKCRLDFEQLKMTIYVKQLADVQGVGEHGFHIYCPACGERNEIALKPYGLFLWKGKFYRWRDAPTRIETSGGVYRVNLGNLTLAFPEDLIGGDNFSKEQICYRAVPVFQQMDGSIMLPVLPVKREFLNLVDKVRGFRSEVTGKGENRFVFYLHVLEEPVEIVLPCVPVQPGRPTAPGTLSTFEGVHLILWPKVTYANWRRYFLRFGCTDNHADSLVNSSRDVKVWAFASKTLEAESAAKEWLPLDVASPNKQMRFGCVESRPDWVAIEFEDTLRREQVGGGIWQIDAARDTYQPQLETTLGVDFGTSNTCIAWGDAESVKLISIAPCDQYIIGGSKVPEKLDFPDTWPPRQGFGRGHALLPTEILTREKTSEYRIHGKNVKDWRPVVDYSIPTGGVEALYPEREHVIADFKWQSMIGDEWYRGQYMDLQQKYIEFLLLLAMAELAKQSAIGSTLDVKFSFPLAFDEQMQRDFRTVLDASARQVERQTGIIVRPVLETDEARAASSADEPSAHDSACLYVDIGGGSTDIALLELGTNANERSRYNYICSFQYAGGALAAALVEGNCLRAGNDISHFRRKIREAGNITELMNAQTLFSSNRTRVIANKSNFFYAYLRQFLARLLAAHIINKALPAAGNGSVDDNQPAATRETYRVLLYPLGNGWGFGSFIGMQYASGTFCQKLTSEANAIIDEAIEKRVVPPTTPRLEIKGKTVENPKNAVAAGLLSGGDDSDVRREDWPWRTIVGWTTQVGRTQKAEWFHPITGGNAENPLGSQPIPARSQLETIEDEWPAFPSKLPTPYELADGDLSEVRRALARCTPTAVDQDWLVDSPFHVLLEKLFKPALKELG
jgi:hypothetical protein